MTQLITASISTQVLKFKPGESPATFEVIVNNDSDRFASFQVDIIAAGTDTNPDFTWYKITPAVSAKKPPGDSTEFDVAIIDTPVPGFAGIANLTVRIYSPELHDEERLVLRLVVQEGADANPLKLELPIKVFQNYPGDRIEIPVRVYNPNPQSTEVILNFMGIDSDWFINGTQRRFQLPRGGQTEVTFTCQPSTLILAPSQIYPFTVEASHRHGSVARVGGTLEVLPTGTYQFDCYPKQQQIPSRDKGKVGEDATYELQFINASNLRNNVNLEVKQQRGKNRESKTQLEFEIIPETPVLLPGETTNSLLVVKKQRPRWGFPQKYRLNLIPILIDPRLGATEPASQTVELRVLPLVPFWLQLLGLLLALLLIFLLLIRPFQGHTAPVTSVQFNGLVDRVISASEDQTLRGWNQQNYLKYRGIFAPIGKSVRVVRFRPVDNNLVAAGLENGEIQIWDLLSKQRQQSLEFVKQKDDRVFGLEFSRDSRYLFSGHGSGLVLQWQLNRNAEENRNEPDKPLQQRLLDFAISDLVLVGTNEQSLAVGGRFNQLVLWNWNSNELRSLNYRSGGQDDYITSVDAADDRPSLMASADNQGYITLWNMRQCLSSDPDCEILDEWREGHERQPVRSVALSPNGCYLATAGDDGRVKLWTLTAEGRRDRNSLVGQVLGKFPTKFNSVDLKIVEDRILVVSGSDDHRVRLYRVKPQKSNC